MTKQQEKLVTDHHYLIAQCMKICKIPLKFHDDYYGDAAIGLCEAAIKFDELNLNIGEFPVYSRTVIVNKIRKLQERNMCKKRYVIEVPIHRCNNIEDKIFENNLDIWLIFYGIYGLLYMKEQIIVKMILEGYTCAEIGDKLGMSGQAIHKRIKKIRKRLTSTTDLARCSV